MKSFLKRALCHPSVTYLRNKIFTSSSSYAQKNEDLVITALIGKVDKFIDIGANDGISGSNSFFFALNGAAGLCFEPVNEIFIRLSGLYRFNKRIICINEGVSDVSKSYEIRVDGVISTILETEDPVNKICLKDFVDKNARKEFIDVKPLSYHIENHPEFQDVDFMSIDVEGHELNVVRGIDFNRIKIKCIIIESLGGKTTNYDQIESLLKQNKFIPVLTNELNTFFIYESYLNRFRIETILKNYSEYRSFI